MLDLRASPGLMQIVLEVHSPCQKPKGRLFLSADTRRQPDGLLRRLARFFPCELSHTTPARNAMANAVVDLIDVGTTNSFGCIKIYDEFKVTRLAKIFTPNPAFSDAVSGVAQGNSLPWSDADADGSGDADSFEVCDRDENVIMQGSVNQFGTAEMNFNQVGILINDVVKILAASYTAAP